MSVVSEASAEGLLKVFTNHVCVLVCVGDGYIYIY